jgi:hypothetical protein
MAAKTHGALGGLAADAKDAFLRRFEQESDALAARFQSFAVTTQQEYEQVGLTLTEIAAAIKVREDFMRPIKEDAHRAHRTACEREKTLLAPLQKLMTTLKAAALAWKTAEDRRRREEEARLAEQTRRQLEDLAVAQAAQLEAAGQGQAAALVLEQAVSTPLPVIVLPPAAPAVDGVATTKRWAWRPIGGETPDARERAVQLVPRQFLELADAKITAYVRAMKGTARIPGIEVYEVEDLRVSARVA